MTSIFATTIGISNLFGWQVFSQTASPKKLEKPFFSDKGSFPIPIQKNIRPYLGLPIKSLVLGTITFSFLFDNYYLIID